MKFRVSFPSNFEKNFVTFSHNLNYDFFSEKILKNQNKFCKIYITFISPPSKLKKSDLAFHEKAATLSTEQENSLKIFDELVE